MASIALLITLLLMIKFQLKKEKININKFQEQIKFLKSEILSYKERAEDLEDKIEHDFGVQVRNIVNEIKIDFTKIEMVVMLSGVNKIIKDSSNVDDLKIYITLYDKLQEAINKMKEDQPIQNKE
jgi:hypothetical protein